MFRNNKREICFRPLSRYGWFPTDSSLSVAQMKKAFPSPLEVWVVSYRIPGTRNHKYARFPSPLEVWVVSYELKDYLGLKTTKCFRPLSRYGWFPTLSGLYLDADDCCFRPLSRYGWFPTPYLVSQKGNNTQDSSSLETILSIPYFPRAFS